MTWKREIAKNGYGPGTADHLESALAEAGFAVVPVEPTQSMARDGSKALRDWYTKSGPYPRTKAVWQAMLAAAKGEGEK